LLIGKDKAKKSRLPTAEQFLSYIPKRSELEWKINDEDIVEINMPKFKSSFGKSFCRLIKRDENLVAKMDKIGSIVWKNCDGKRSVKDIFNILKKKFPKEENLDQRLFLFLSQMRSLQYIDY
jgi:hypothetical protein